MSKRMKTALLAVMLAALAVLVPSPALAMGHTPYGLCVAAAVLCAVLLLRGLRFADVKRRYRDTKDGPVSVIFKADHLDLALWCVPPAFVFARLSYCLARFSFYFLEMGPVSVLRTWEGGFMLYGALLGALLGGVLLARRRRMGVPALLDEMAAPGLLCVAVCRLGEYFTGEGVGAWVESELMMRFPFAVVNEFEEWQLAVFLLEALCALALMFAALRVQQGEGKRILFALLMYACCQVVLESMRMDSCLKIGFVRVSQVLSGVLILAVTGLRAWRSGGKRMAVRRALPVALCVAVVGAIEWALDKTVVNNVLLYALMIAACACMGVNGMRFEKRGLTD